MEVAGLGLLLALGGLSCSKREYGGAVGGKSSAPAPVTAAKARTQDVPLEVKTFGNVVSVNTLNLTSQVGGVLMESFFAEGQQVRKGDRLVRIDPRPFEAALREAQANAVRDRAQLKYFHADVRRLEELFKRRAASVDEVDEARSRAAAMEATVKADEALIETAKLNLAYTDIRSSIEGIAGKLLVDEGNVVKANDTTLVVINQVQPTSVEFSLPQGRLAEVRREMAKGKLTVLAYPPGRERTPQRGELTFLDNAVDPNTGMFRVQGTFDNKDRALWPGQFVDVTLILTTLRGAVVVPSSAVQTGPEGTFVFVIGADLTVAMVPVATGTYVNNLTVIDKGVRPGQTVVTDGQLLLSPGAKVEIKK